MTQTFLLFQAERLADYGRLLAASQPSLDGRLKDLDRIQNLFTHDHLSLHSLEPAANYYGVRKLYIFRKLHRSTSSFFFK